MERHLLAAACLALVATTAGCAGFLGAGSTPTPTPEVSGPAVAPGVPAVDANGTEVPVNAARLRAANAALRANTSYTVRRTVTVTDGNDGTLDFDRTRLVGSDATLERLSIDESAQFTAVLQGGTRWTDGNGTWTRTNLSNGRTTITERLGDELDPYGYGDSLADRALTAARYQVRDGPGGVVLLTRELDFESESLTPLSTGPPIDERVRLVVAESGLVRSLAVRYDTVYGTQTVTVTIQHDLVDVGQTSVERPAWVPTDG